MERNTLITKNFSEIYNMTDVEGERAESLGKTEEMNKIMDIFVKYEEILAKFNQDRENLDDDNIYNHYISITEKLISQTNDIAKTF